MIREMFGLGRRWTYLCRGKTSEVCAMEHGSVIESVVMSAK